MLASICIGVGRWLCGRLTVVRCWRRVRIVNDRSGWSRWSVGRVRRRRWWWKPPTAGTGAVDALQADGARVHLTHPLGVKAFEYRRVKNDVRDAIDLADLLRMGRLPEAWIAPPATRELRELVRHRAKLVALRSLCKAEIHAVLAKCGVQVPMSDLFGMAGTALLDRLRLPAPCAARIGSLRRVIESLEFEIDVFANLASGRLARDRGYAAVQTVPGIGPTWVRCSWPRSAT